MSIFGKIFGKTKQRDAKGSDNNVDLCDKAIRYREQFKYYETIPGGMPSSAKKDFYGFVRCIEQLSQMALAEKKKGIFLPKEAQIIKDIYRVNFSYLEIHMACHIALKKLNML